MALSWRSGHVGKVLVGCVFLDIASASKFISANGLEGFCMRTSFFYALMGVVLLVSLSQVPAQAAVLPYGNNPFKFCSEGMPDDGWVPVDWRTGTYRYTRRAKRVNKVWIPVFQTVCPLAAVGGTSIGGGGRGAEGETAAQPGLQMQPMNADPAATF